MNGARRLAGPLVALATVLAWAPGASALVDHAGNEVPATSTAGTAAQLDSGPTLTQMLFSPATPGDDDPSALAALESSASPEDDLGAALDALRDASSAADAQDARSRAMDILLGDPVPDRVYSGMPLLNWDVPSKVKDVPPGGDVQVREVRFGDTALVDTSLLHFDDPSQPFTITYEIAELGPGPDGELAPTPLLSDSGGPIGGLHSILEPLTFSPVDTGTSTANRFTALMGMPNGGKEQTREGVQRITVRMPPPRYVDEVLDPDLVAHGDPMSAGGDPLTALRPATAGRVAEVDRTFGYSGNAPTSAQRATAITSIGAAAPERILYQDLRDLDPTDLAGAHALGTQDRSLVTAMRTHDQLPPGFAGDPAADASMVLLNDEPYRTRDELHLAPGGSVSVSVTNGDTFTRTITATQLYGRHAALGAVDWGQFSYDAVGAVSLGPGESHTFTFTPRDDAFELVFADPDHGEQGNWALGLDRGPLKQSLDLGPRSDPTHLAQDANGNMWVTLAGIDAIGRLTPGADISTAHMQQFLIPGGNHTFDPVIPPLGPHALQFDADGILWVTLDAGNAIARVDPSAVQDGTDNGIRVYHLNDCPQTTCPPPFPPEPGAPPPPTRLPVQMDLEPDGSGGTIVFFAEENASAIGALHVAADGTELDKADFPCDCKIPTGMRLGPDGSVWFAEIVENRIGRLTLDSSQPFKASAAKLDQFTIPGGVTQVDPALVPGGATFFSSAPHSLTVDRHGNVWFSEQATSSIGMLDPDKAHPGTSDGITETKVPTNDFGRDPLPADITVDRRDNVFWADEYGDAVGALSPGGINREWRPAARNSLTDSPVADRDGNLWFIEHGAGLVTRLSGITGGPFDRSMSPPTFTARTAGGTLSGDGLGGFTSLDVAVTRGGSVVKQVSGAAVSGGSLTLDLGLQGGDTVQITPHGDFAPAPFAFTVARLAIDVAGGSATGSATSGGAALADKVVVSSDGHATHDAAIDPAGGAFSASDVGDQGEVTWGQGTPMGVFRTVTRFGTATSAPGAPSAPPAAKKPGPPSQTKKKPTLADACRSHIWLIRTGKSRTIPLLGATSKQVLACLGRPTSAAKRGGVQRWRWGKSIEVRIKGGRAFAITLRDKRFTSRPDGLRVGARLSVAGRALGTPAVAARRARLRRSDGQYADVKLAVRAGKVRSITITLHRARSAQ